MGLASTTSRAGTLEVGKQTLLGQASFLDRHADAVGQRIEKVALDLKRERLTHGRHEKPHDLAVPRDHDRLMLLEHLRGAVSKIPDGRRNHVPTLVPTILAALN